MKITAATFHACVTSLEALPSEKLPVIALVGRSNVGKSSLINTLVGRRELAKTSSTPGKTLTINFYLINDQFYLVDLPGYGYAKASRITRQRIQKMMDEFFEGCPEIKGLVQVLDARHPPSTLDLQMYAWIQERGFPYLAVLTKVDKLTQQQVQRQRREILKDLRIGHAVLFSAKTRQGREELLEAFGTLLDTGAFPGGRGGGQSRREGGAENRSRGRRRGGGGRETSSARPPTPGAGKAGSEPPREPAAPPAPQEGQAAPATEPPTAGQPPAGTPAGPGTNRQSRRRPRHRGGSGGDGGGKPGSTRGSGPRPRPGGQPAAPGDRNHPDAGRIPPEPAREPISPSSTDQKNSDKGENPS
ncbi:MAG: GTP-binding protein EngB [Candidatus Ozemobacter sibiricus]|uniref:Probable GTP-binding protein EngB n=1 Tax=Candidatus Ozemobacter sibiricus TaxID=2268124 RepID=A0A367ZM10_9BACT|nr:MAG: GTP-binding protein EngB [Candidatus Ozemobacter sibiricus]